MHIDYAPRGTCSKAMLIDVDEATHRIQRVRIVGGCPGNTVGLSRLAEGQQVEEVIAKLEGIPCRDKGTSCPDQLAQALKQALQPSAGQAIPQDLRPLL